MPFFPQPTGTSAARSPHASSCFWLRSHRPSGPRGLCTTQAGPLLKHQIPIRTFHGWDNAHPGFLEADLVAHNGGDSEGCSLYTFSLTDGTECLPLLYKSPEAVLAAFQQARVLFPFPILGLDTDNGQVRLQMTATPQAIQLLPDVRLWQARLALESGDLQNAACLLETLDLEEHMAPRIFQARLLLVQQKPETARQQLERLLPEASEWRHILEIQILLALTHAACQEGKSARARLRQALSHAHSAGLIRPFLSEGMALAHLLRQLVPALQEPALRSYVITILVSYSLTC